MKTKELSFMLRFRQALRKDKELPPHLKNALSAIASFTNGTGYCFVTMEKLGVAMGVQTRQARYNVRALEVTGWLWTSPNSGGRGRCNEFQLVVPDEERNPALNPAMGEAETRHWDTPKPGTAVPPEGGDVLRTSLETKARVDTLDEEDVAALYEMVYGTGSSTPSSSREEVLGEEPSSGDEPVLPFATGSSASRPATDDSIEVPEWVKGLSLGELHEAPRIGTISFAVFRAELERREGGITN